LPVTILNNGVIEEEEEEADDDDRSIFNMTLAPAVPGWVDRARNTSESWADEGMMQ
jgi:hypothetical protein